jgi:hypothetical protein
MSSSVPAIARVGTHQTRRHISYSRFKVYQELQSKKDQTSLAAQISDERDAVQCSAVWFNPNPKNLQTLRTFDAEIREEIRFLCIPIDIGDNLS